MKTPTIQLEIKVTKEMLKAYEWDNYGLGKDPMKRLASILKNEIKKDIDSTIAGYRRFGKK